MILEFKRSEKHDNRLSSVWNGIIVLMDKLCDLEEGHHDVMFTFATHKAIIANPAEGLRVTSDIGFQRLLDKRVPQMLGEDPQGNKVLVRIGWLVNKSIYVADHSFAQYHNIPLLRLGGTYYTTFCNGHNYVCGVEDPSMLLRFASKHPKFVKLV